MRKGNVFLVTGRQGDASGDPRGPLVSQIVCAEDEEAVRAVTQQTLPGLVIVSAVNLAILEQTTRKIKDVLAGTDTSWPVFVDPSLQH